MSRIDYQKAPILLGRIKDLGETLSGVAWGIRADSLTTEDAQAYRDGGCDLLAFQLQGTSLGVVASEDSARVLCVNPCSAI